MFKLDTGVTKKKKNLKYKLFLLGMAAWIKEEPE